MRSATLALIGMLVPIAAAAVACAPPIAPESASAPDAAAIATAPEEPPAAISPTALPAAEDAAGAASPAPSDAEPDAEGAIAAVDLDLAGASVESLCVRPDRQDVVFGLRPPNVQDPAQRGAPYLRLYRVPFDDEGHLGNAAVMADFGAGFGDGEAWVERVQCHEGTDRVLVTLGNQRRSWDDDSWWSELWLLDGEGERVVDHAMARDVGPYAVAWSPDGNELLLEGNFEYGPGAVYAFEIARERNQLVDGAYVWTPAGGGGGTMHWSSDGRFAIAESYVVLAQGGFGHMLQSLEHTDLGLQLASEQELPGAIAMTANPTGGFVVVSSEGGTTDGDTPLTVALWDAERPGEPLSQLGVLGGDAPPDMSPRDVHVLSRPDLGAEAIELVFMARSNTGSGQALYRAVPSPSEDASPIEPISPPGDAVDAFDVAGGWLAYSLGQSRGDDGDALSVAVTDRLRVVRLADVDG